MAKLLILDSNKASNNIFKLDKWIEGRYKLLSFISTNNIYNITDENNKIYWDEEGTDITTTLTNGYYDETSFISHISSQLNNDSAYTISVSLDENTRKLTITSTSGGFYFTFGTNTSNSARKLLGYNEEDGTDNTTQVSNIPIDLNTYKNIYIKIKQDDDRNIEGIEFFNQSLVINGIGNYGEILRYIDNDNFNQYIKFSKKTKQIDISFYDINNNNINLNSEYQIILQKL